MPHSSNIAPSRALKSVRYEIRGRMARRALELERQGYEILSLNIGNGVSELIDLTLRALLNPGDEVLIPSPDYPLWTAATVLNGGKAVYYPCPEQDGYMPDVAAVKKLITKKTRAIVIINPNNPTGAVYNRECLTRLAEMAEKHDLSILADEIYDQMIFGDTEFVPMATLCSSSLCATFSGLSKVYRACGYRVGWVAFSGALDRSDELLEAMDLLAALRLCSNVPGQWAVQTALGGYQSIRKLCSNGGRLYQSRQAVVSAVDESKYLTLVPPEGAMYAFIGVDTRQFPGFDDESFCMELLEQQHVLIAPGSSFNVSYRSHFRITTLADEDTIGEVFWRIHNVLGSMAKRPPKLESAR